MSRADWHCLQISILNWLERRWRTLPGLRWPMRKRSTGCPRLRSNNMNLPNDFRLVTV